MGNLKKTLYYLKRNGIGDTWYALKERLARRHEMPYAYDPVPAERLAAQREWSERLGERERILFSIVVPAYRTPEKYLSEMILSVLMQSYSHWELILADATEDDSVALAAGKYRDPRLRYIRLAGNGGISENTNRALGYAAGGYVGLLDHDDVLTPDALYEMAVRIVEGKRGGRVLQMLYSDEDKCDAERNRYYEPNRKEEFNLDLLLSNNYICHFLVMRRELIRELGFRREFDGAQDYDLVLRAAERLLEREEEIAHVPAVLYHWRCHEASTAENPESKAYAYEAGRRALQDFADRQGYGATAAALAHLGFYRLVYSAGLPQSRPDLGAAGGRVIRKGRIAGGRMTDSGKLFYEGLPRRFSGPLHRAVLTQDAEAVDIRCIRVREECRELFKEITGVSYTENPSDGLFDTAELPEGTDCGALSLRLCRGIREAGYRILYDPGMERYE